MQPNEQHLGNTWRAHVWKLVRFLVGGLLLTAAVVKLSGLSYGPVARVFYLRPAFQFVVIQLELLLGGWLLLGLRPLGARWLAGAVFLGFAVVSGYAAMTGQSNCGCFGKLEVSPWYAFGLDVTVLAALALARPGGRGAEGSRGWIAGLGSAIIALGLASIVAVAVQLGAQAAFGSFEHALALLRGQTLVATPATLDLGTGNLGDELLGEVEVENISGTPVRIIAGTADCTCVTTERLPVVIGPGDRQTLPIRLFLKGSEGVARRSVVLVTDSPGTQSIRINLRANAVAQAP